MLTHADVWYMFPDAIRDPELLNDYWSDSLAGGESHLKTALENIHPSVSRSDEQLYERLRGKLRRSRGVNASVSIVTGTAT